MLIQTHPLLSEEAQALSPESFAEYLALAQEAFEIVGVAFRSDQESRVDRALAFQVNLLLAQGREGEMEIFQAVSRGERSWTFRERPNYVSKVGARIIREILGVSYGWEGYTSRRSTAYTPLSIRKD